ncbi:hypothetical protein SAMN05216412_101186 [Nitrosospira multiformis]|uniref:Uncharacterized protein n=1 Tax=Nitrosospira multiformis TaxID=1231 RepID=A0A1H9YFZ5_9PROT|nr:hypothetical protein [Nitrosospira multiformis]SES67374.1 hypothetical protein SAMN05216412_101186 [Nitrosospira multiformis]
MKEIKRFRQTTPDRLEIREDGGCLSLLLAIPFLAAALISTLIGLGIVPIINTAEVIWPRLVGFGMGLAFFLVVGFLFSRRWVIIDISRGRIQKLWGLLVPMLREDVCLRDYHAVGLRYAIDEFSGAKYRVVLLVGNLGRDIDLHCTDHNRSHEEALFLARFLRFPLEDSTTDQETNEKTSCPWPGFPLDDS